MVLLGVAIGLLVGPIRNRARRFANRLVYGNRATPYEVLSEFSERVGGAYSDEDVLPRMVQILASATGATRATVWLLVGGELRPAATSGGELPRAMAAAFASTGKLAEPDKRSIPVQRPFP